MAKIAGEALERPCGNTMHGQRFGRFMYSTLDFDPNCQTCMVREMLAKHDHLHLDGAECNTIGLEGPGHLVKCSCGSYHH